MTDILFINPSDQLATYQHLSESLTAFESPLQCRLLASYLRGKGASVAIADCQDPAVDYLGFILDLKPRLIVVVVHGNQPSASTQTMPAAIRVCKSIMGFSPEIPVLVIGGHPAALPERTLEETGADAVCAGEGFTTCAQFLAAIKNEPVKWKYLLHKIDGLCYWDHDEPVRSNPAWNITGLRDVPGGCWDLLPMSIYRAHLWHTLGMESRQPYASIQTTWGCPHSCTYCCIQSQFREGDNLKFGGKANSYRMWPVECVLAEIETLIEKHGVTNIKIADEMFWLNPKHVLSICDGIIERGWGNALNIWCYSRVDSVRDEYLEKSRRAGIRWVALGIEALSDEVRDGVDKADYGAEDIYRTVKKIREHGINVIGNYIFGLPHEDKNSMQQTLDLALELQTESVNFYCFPGDTDLMLNPVIKPISEVRVGAKVLTAHGYTDVLDTLRRPYCGDMLKIKARMLPPVEMTPNHPVMTATLKRTRRGIEIVSKQWKKAKDVIPFSVELRNRRLPYDAVLVPKNLLPARPTFADFSGFINSPNKKGYNQWKIRQFHQPIPVTKELAELIGWYVAEGSLGSRKNDLIVFSLSAKETTNIERIRFLLKKVFNFKSGIRKNKGDSVLIIFRSKVLMAALPVMCGHRASSKCVPDFILHASNEVVSAFIDGYTKGDGWVGKRVQAGVSSCSRHLTLQIFLLLLKLGILASYDEAPRPPGIIIKEKPIAPGTMFRLLWTKKKQFSVYREDENYYYLPIREITKRNYDGCVYDIKTTAGQFALPFLVHNCAMAYPGSKLFNDAITKGWKVPESWSEYSHHSYECKPLGTETLSPAEILRFNDDAFHAYFTNESYLAMIARKFGPLGIEQIKAMTAKRLPRKLLETDCADASLALPETSAHKG